MIMSQWLADTDLNWILCHKKIQDDSWNSYPISFLHIALVFRKLSWSYNTEDVPWILNLMGSNYLPDLFLQREEFTHSASTFTEIFSLQLFPPPALFTLLFLIFWTLAGLNSQPCMKMRNNLSWQLDAL